MIVIPIAVASEFGYVLLAAAILAFECVLIGLIFPTRVRPQVFTEEFMKINYQQVHGEAGFG